MCPGEENSTISAPSTASEAPAAASPEITTTIPPPDQRTQAIPSAEQPASAAAAIESDEMRDRKLAQELSRRGIPADEVHRLLSLGKTDAAPIPMGKRVNPVLVSPPELPPSEAFEPKPTIT